jgi:hypothetical protein
LNAKNSAGSGLRNWARAAFAVVLLLAIAVRIHLLGIPLERDEGEFAYIAQLMLEGVAPYKLAYVIKLPGTPALYALAMLFFGQTPTAIHLALLIANLIAVLLLFILARQWFGEGVALVAGVTYALMSLSWCCAGMASHATQFLVPAVLGGMLLLGRGLRTNSLPVIFVGGLLFGFSFLIKQQGIPFSAFGAYYVICQELKGWREHFSGIARKLSAYALGWFLPFAILCLVEWHAGVFQRFWFWSFTVPGNQWTAWSTAEGNLSIYFHWIQASRDLLFWLAGAGALVAAWWMPLLRPHRTIFLAFCAAGFAATTLGLRFNNHYFVMSLPGLSVLIGLGVVELNRLLRGRNLPVWVSWMPAAAFLAICALFVQTNYAYLAGDSAELVAEKVYLHNPFREAAVMAAYIRANSSADSRVAVLGSEPEIYFLSHRHAATGHVSTYLMVDERPWSHRLQAEMREEILAAEPEYIVLVKNNFSWLNPAAAEADLIDPILRLTHDKYKIVGLAISPASLGSPVYFWGADAGAPHPEFPADSSWLGLYRRVKSS